MIHRAAETTLRELAKGYLVLALTGPRQSGKTTLARAVFSAHPYVTLENPVQREFTHSDPQGFLNKYAEGAIIDEAQRCQELFAWQQGVVDCCSPELERELSTTALLTGCKRLHHDA